ncbi:phage uncharacterized protein (putative large terminase), C-terminal domain-containing protein [Aneurinibacillus thermoaerophilus]|uniref:Phage uncharacterized protein (Putative large terminase), C-terminal domain-containing protein n=1 Tax=Aneurinibacillus thermoaerophilus TaxID=143495 RepID=A0A1G7WPS4_ANETH|nr:phage terminase large subunit [Aneurinibacillus thermoaerophilus]SDG73878.1 phage uncharacterized protein (putative large terminase), C-terminal domain-containing protein [Aneurinibacillus thermoaerophilus]
MTVLSHKEIQVLRELAQTELARRNFHDFCVYMYPEFFTPNKPHAKKIAETLQQSYEDYKRGLQPKIIIALPPRAGKSFIISLFCAWLIGKEPKESIMRNTYSASLAEDFSYYIRELIQTEKYLKIFPHIKLKQDKSKIDGWSIEGAPRTTYFCAGVGGSITGKGATILAVLDDPIKNMEDAMSPVIRKKTWEWYTSTHKTRLEGNCIEIVIATRWHTEDPTGKIMELDKNENEWKKIIIPALDENGKSYCEEIKSTEDFLKLKKSMDSFIWDALYMQKPANVDGVLFKKNELNYFTMQELNKLLRNKKPDVIVGYTDVADTGADSLCSLIGYKFEDKVYIADVIFTQDPVEVTEPLVAQQIITHKPNTHTIESNNGGRSFALNVQRLVSGKTFTFINTKQNTQNKETRILMKSGQIKQHFVFREDYEIGSDYDKFMNELTSYVKLGKNKHDDAVDAATGLAETIFEENNIQLGGKVFSRR